MDTEHAFAYTDIYPSWFPNAIGKALSVMVHGLQLSKADDTHVQAVAGANDQAAVVSVRGRWRWIEATLTRAHPGGAAGLYDIFATCIETDIESTPQPFTDDTNYAFNLAIVAAGSTPPIVAGVVDLYRKVGHLSWDGTRILWVRQTVGMVQRPRREPHAFTFGSDQVLPAAGTLIGATITSDAGDETHAIVEVWISALITGTVRPALTLQAFRPADSVLADIPGLAGLSVHSYGEAHPAVFRPTSGPFLLPAGSLLVAKVATQGDYQGVVGSAILEAIG